MTRRTAAVLLALGLLASSRCGKKGAIMAPLLRVPQAVRDLSLSRIGNRVILSWTNPTSTVDGAPLGRVTEVEIWVVELPKPAAAPETATTSKTAATPPAAGAPAAKLTPADIEKKGRLFLKVPEERLASLAEKTGANPRLVLALEPGPEELAQKTLFFSLRVRDERRRRSEFSEPAVAEAGAALASPRGITARVFEDHIEVRWETAPSPGGAAPSGSGGYNIYRSEGEAAAVRLNKEPVRAAAYRDESFSFGKVYRYFVRSASAAAPAGLESEDSEIVKVDALDTFPPAAPQGLTIIAGQGFVALSWAPAPEPDLAGYRVWRREASQTKWTLLKELPPAESSLTDTTVEKNKRYVYAITAFDRAGNESPKSGEATGLSRRSGE